MPNAQQLPDGHPLVEAFALWKVSGDDYSYENAKRWALVEQHTEGALWTAFSAGWKACEDVFSDAPDEAEQPK